jgi:hypothetical protein
VLIPPAREKALHILTRVKAPESALPPALALALPFSHPDDFPGGVDGNEGHEAAVVPLHAHGLLEEAGEVFGVRFAVGVHELAEELVFLEGQGGYQRCGVEVAVPCFSDGHFDAGVDYWERGGSRGSPGYLGRGGSPGARTARVCPSVGIVSSSVLFLGTEAREGNSSCATHFECEFLVVVHCGGYLFPRDKFTPIILVDFDRLPLALCYTASERP